MGKVALLFAGQGSQHPGMGRELCAVSPAAAAVYAACDEVRPGVSALCFAGSASELNQTDNTQPCMWATDLACARALEARGVRADAVAGFSLGELAALAFAGALTDSDAFEAVCLRAELMAAAAAQNPGAMAAVLKLEPAHVEALAASAGAWAVNYNAPAQTVCAGSVEAIEKLGALVREAGGRCMPLKVSGAFHSPFMEPATTGLRTHLAGVDLREPRIPVWSNVTGEPYPAQAGAARDLLARQASSPVLWTRTLEGLAAWGVDTFVEVGPGKVLAGLVARTLPHARAFSVETPTELEEAVASL